MTVSYTADVANASGFGVFTNILLKWKGSVYKLVFKELIAFLVIYFMLNIFYRTVLMSEGMEYYRHLFESLKAYCSIQMSSIPMTFVLGFYVSLIVKRWWDQYNLLPWPDSLAIFIVGLLHGLDERGRLMRRNIMRYILLAYVITLRRVSFRVRKRFPTIDHVIDAGLMRSDELKCMELLNEKCSVSKWWMPLVWATNIVDRARQENRIKSDPGMQTILAEISRIRMGLTGVQHYDTISVPLVYTQVVSLAVYSYFLAALMGAQWVGPTEAGEYKTIYKLPVYHNVVNSANNYHHEVNSTVNSTASEAATSASGLETAGYHGLDLYYPFFLTLQFAFYVGWLKVAETLINPFGEDDDDFELNYLIDRHIQVSYMIVDDMHHNHPELLKDAYWNQTVPSALPYTIETAHYRKDEPLGSAEKRGDEEIYYATASLANGGKPRASGGKGGGHYGVTLFKNKLASSKSAGLDAEPPYSDYEAVDTNLVGWWKNKIRKSQMRKSLRSMSSAASLALASSNQPKMPEREFARRRSSKGSIYAKLFSAATSRPRRASTSNIAALSGVSHDGRRLVMAEDSIRSAADIDSDLKMIYGTSKPPTGSTPRVRSSTSLSEAGAGSPGESSIEESAAHNNVPPNLSAIEARLRQMTHLSTITENTNSPYSTHVGSRRNSNYPTAAGIFSPSDEAVTAASTASEDTIKPAPHDDPKRKTSQAMSATSSDSPYYPMGSETSARPFSPRFHIEEMSSNYEPVLVSNREIVVTPVTGSPSPMLPKRHARMALAAINLTKNSNPAEEPAENTAPGPSPQKAAKNEMALQEDEEEEEVFEEIDTPADEKESKPEAKTSTASQNSNASSAFDDHATFYV